MVRSNPDAGTAGTPGEYMVEVVGPDGLRHHIGPFKFLAEAEAWIAQNPSDSTSQAPCCGANPAPLRTARIVE